MFGDRVRISIVRIGRVARLNWERPRRVWCDRHFFTAERIRRATHVRREGTAPRNGSLHGDLRRQAPRIRRCIDPRRRRNHGRSAQALTRIDVPNLGRRRGELAIAEGKFRAVERAGTRRCARTRVRRRDRTRRRRGCLRRRRPSWGRRRSLGRRRRASDRGDRRTRLG